MIRNTEHQFSANIYYNGVRHTVYGYARASNTPVARDLLSDYHGTVNPRGRLVNFVFQFYGNRDRGVPAREQSLMVPLVSDLFPPRAADLPSAVRMRFGSPPRHTDTASSSRRPVRSFNRISRALQWDRVSPSDVRQTPPFILPSQYEVPETERSVPLPPDVPIVVENRDPNADVFFRGPHGIVQFRRVAPLPVGTDTETEGGRSELAATSQAEPEAEGVLRAIGRRLWFVAEDYNPFKRRT